MRIGRKDLEETVNYFNGLIEGSDKRVKIGERYGYTALDEYSGNRMNRTIVSGLTKSQAQEYIWAMRNGLGYAYDTFYNIMKDTNMCKAPKTQYERDWCNDFKRKVVK